MKTINARDLSLAAIFSLLFFCGCAKRYELGMMAPRAFKMEALKSKKALLEFTGNKIRDRYEDRDIGLDLAGVQATSKKFFQQKFSPLFSQFQIDQGDLGNVKSDILFYPALEISPTDDGPLARDLVIHFSLLAQDQMGKKLGERNMEKRIHYATTTKGEIENSLAEVFNEVSEDLLRDLSQAQEIKQ